MLGVDPHFHHDANRAASHLKYIAVAGHYGTHMYRRQENHAIDSDGGYPALGYAAGGDHPGDIHLGQQPAAKNVAIGIGLSGHSNSLRD